MRLSLDPNRRAPRLAILFLAAAVAGTLPAGAAESTAAPPGFADWVAENVGVTGGLCVQVGATETDRAVELADTGRFLVQVLDADARAVDRTRARLRAEKSYGLVSVDRLPKEGGLPYTEDLVNLLVVSAGEAAWVAPHEILRVLCPRGVALFASGKTTAERLTAAGFIDVGKIAGSGDWLAARKPWPPAMDEWSHPRHSASGNAVSRDTAVAPPRRVRWVVGAESEVRGMVTARGRNYYAGVLARDGFNGLRLWNRDLIGTAGDGRFTMKNLGPGNVPPVAGGERLYVVEGGKLLALSGATGEPLIEYPDAGRPRTVLCEQGTLVVATADSVRALDAASAGLKWSFTGSDPRHLVAGDDTVAFVRGRGDRGEPIEAVALSLSTGKPRFQTSEFPWLTKVSRAVYHRGIIAYEMSTFNDTGPGNALHLVSAEDGIVRLDHPFLPGMNHTRQARAMFVDDRMWLLHGGRGEGDERFPIRASAYDFRTGKELVTHPAGLAHCFPQVMTVRYMLSGEMDLTDLKTGEVDAHQITKAACGRDGGWVPANGLIYVTPKHCVCWPMLRGYAALAPERPAGSVADMDPKTMAFPLETSGVAPPDVPADDDDPADWPCYRHDAWRSGSTAAAAPPALDELWSADFGDMAAAGPIVDDWRENPFVKGPITPPVIAGDRVVLARPDRHEVVGLDAADGSTKWRFTAAGRVDTAPTLFRGLCLFGTKSGWVYCLRADDGRMVWRLRAAPLEEQIVANGQLESPWPVPGSVLVVEGVAYFAAGRQSLADGGILVFAADPAAGRIRWVRRLDSVPQKGFYECSGLEFDNFDLLHREGDGVGMSRWVFNRQSGEMSLDRWTAFAKLDTGGGAAMVPRGCWSYAPRHQRRIPSFTPRRPPAVFRDNVLFGCLQASTTVYRREFHFDQGETFETKWITGWAASGLSREGKMPWPSYRLAEKASWKVDPFSEAKNDARSVDAMLLAGDRLFVAGSDGDLRVLSTTDGKPIARHALPAPLWDGMALAGGRLYYATHEGRLLCLGKPTTGR